MLKLSEIECLNSYNIIRDGSFTTPSLKGLDGEHVIICAYGKFDAKYFNSEKTISCVIASDEIARLVPDELGLIISTKPMEVLIKLHLHLFEIGYYKNSTNTTIHETAKIHPTAWVEPYGVHIGQNTIIGSKSSILEGTYIGNNVSIGSNVVIGGEGFETRELEGDLINLPHVGGVIIEDNCNIQSNSSVAKAVFKDFTVIGKSTTIAHNCFVSHGSKIGERTKIAPGAIICGTVKIGKNVWIGPNSTISNSLVIEDNVYISIGSIVVNSLKTNERVYPYFAKARK